MIAYTINCILNPFKNSNPIFATIVNFVNKLK